jgi:hypothetical protein
MISVLVNHPTRTRRARVSIELPPPAIEQMLDIQSTRTVRIWPGGMTPGRVNLTLREAKPPPLMFWLNTDTPICTSPNAEPGLSNGTPGP